MITKIFPWRTARTTRSTGEAAAGGRSAPEDEESILIRRVAAKDRQAFECLYRRYARLLFGYLSKFIAQPEIVEEVVDDVMLVVWQSASRFDHTSRLSTWIIGIAHHKGLKALARASKRATEELPTPPAGCDRDDPETLMMHQELGSTVARALETLSPAHRAVVELTFAQGRSYQEIAAIMGCPVNTVKSRMFHARRHLMQLLHGWGVSRTSAGGGESA